MFVILKNLLLLNNNLQEGICMGKSSLIFLNLILLLLIGCFEKKAKRSDTVEIHVEQRYNSKTVTEISSKEASSQLVSAQSIFVKSAEVSSSIQDHNNYPRVELITSKGSIVLKLNPDKAPKSVENFLNYVRDGHYSTTIFHRVVANFMIQGGIFTEDMQEKSTRAPIYNEADNGLKNTRGTLAMARANDPQSATSQFFINVADNEDLNHSSKTDSGWGYAVFGQVIEGMEVVDQISNVLTGIKNEMRDVPNTPVVIQKAQILSD